METSRFKHIHFISEDILSDFKTILQEFLSVYENLEAYSREFQLANRLLDFICSDDINYYDA